MKKRWIALILAALLLTVFLPFDAATLTLNMTGSGMVHAAGDTFDESGKGFVAQSFGIESGTEITYTVNQWPDKTSYIEGETLSLTGLSVSRTINESTTTYEGNDVLKWCTVSVEGGLTDRKVTMANSGKKITLTPRESGASTTVDAPAPVLTVAYKKINAIVVKTQPVKALSDYVEGQTLDPTGAAVTVIWNNGETADYTMNLETMRFATVKDNNTDATIDMYLNGVKLTSLTAMNRADWNGKTLTAAPSTVTSLKAQFGTVSVANNVVTDITITAMPVTTVFFEQQACGLDKFAGLSVKTIMSNGVANDYPVYTFDGAAWNKESGTAPNGTPDFTIKLNDAAVSATTKTPLTLTDTTLSVKVQYKLNEADLTTKGEQSLTVKPLVTLLKFADAADVPHVRIAGTTTFTGVANGILNSYMGGSTGLKNLMATPTLPDGVTEELISFPSGDNTMEQAVWFFRATPSGGTAVVFKVITLRPKQANLNKAIDLARVADDEVVDAADFNTEQGALDWLQARYTAEGATVSVTAMQPFKAAVAGSANSPDGVAGEYKVNVTYETGTAPNAAAASVEKTLTLYPTKYVDTGLVDDDPATRTVTGKGVTGTKIPANSDVTLSVTVTDTDVTQINWYAEGDGAPILLGTSTVTGTGVIAKTLNTGALTLDKTYVFRAEVVKNPQGTDNATNRVVQAGGRYTVRPMEDILAIAPAITSSVLLRGTVNASYSQKLEATGTDPITWSLVSGSLPSGLIISSDGLLFGTPTAAGTFDFTVKATNTAGSDGKLFSITVADASPAGSGDVAVSTVTKAPATGDVTEVPAAAALLWLVAGVALLCAGLAARMINHRKRKL